MRVESYAEELIAVALLNERMRVAIHPRQLTEVQCECGEHYVEHKGHEQGCPRCKKAAA